MSFCPGCPKRSDRLSCGSRGPIDAKLLIIGMAPGHEELAVRKPFVGASGRIMAAAMIEAGLTPGSARVMNLVNCLPAGGVKQKIRVNGRELVNGNRITHDQLQACSQRFSQELQRLDQVKVVMVLGTEAFQRVTGEAGLIGKWQCHPLRAVDCKAYKDLEKCLPPKAEWIIPAYHPAFVRYSGLKNFGALKAGFEKVKEKLEGKDRTIVVSGPGVGLGELASLARSPEPPGPVAADIETEGLEGGVERISFAWKDRSGEVRSGSWLWTPTVKNIVQMILGRPDAIKVFHNAAFDIRRLRREDVETVEPVWDTMLAHQLLNPELDKSLTAVSGYQLDIAHWKHLSKTDPAHYNRMDSHVTRILYDTLRHDLDRTGLVGLFEKSVMPAMFILTKMSDRGLRIDKAKLELWKQSLETREADSAVRIWELAGWAVNLKSPKQLQKLLYVDLDLPIQRNKGQVTTDRGALEKLRRVVRKEVTNPRRKDALDVTDDQTGRARLIIDALIENRESHKLLKTYAQEDQDVVHPSYFPVGKDDDRFGTATGRLSSQDPNIQNQPKVARMIYVPHGEKNVFLEADYSQIELRVAAWLAGEDVLNRAFARGDDVHAQTERLLGCDRTRAKNVTYGTLYGAGPLKLVETLRAEGYKATLAETKTLQAAFFKAYPKLAAWRQEVVGQVARLGYAANVFGRRRYFLDADGALPEIVNFYPQSTVADIMLKMLPYVEEVFDQAGGELLTTVHDSFLGEIPEAEIAQAADNLKRVMEDKIPELNGFSCPVDLKVGRRWGRMHKLRPSILVPR